MTTPNDREAIARIAENLACIAGIIADGAQPADARRRLEIVNDGVDVALAMRRLANDLRADSGEAGATAMARGGASATQCGVGDAPRESSAAAPATVPPSPPPIPLGAVVEDGDGVKVFTARVSSRDEQERDALARQLADVAYLAEWIQRGNDPLRPQHYVAGLVGGRFGAFAGLDLAEVSADSLPALGARLRALSEEAGR